MPSTASGRIVKTRKVKKGTPHQKNHRWESFTTKISKLNSLDPIRKVRRHDFDAEDISTSTSYFKAGLDKWQELNLSEVYVDFSRHARPLCDSLPQILHHEAKIMELLCEHIEKKERYSLEPLLELFTDFAHDLGTRFEKYYARALGLLMCIAGSPQEVEVIEWTFSSLAFLFKYLSKLLVPDLRPTYNIMAPVLGKQRQPPHIARFTAEAFSFLVKKAGAPAYREKALPLIVQHAHNDLLSMYGSRAFGLYYHGVMTLFAEAIKGTGMAVHTSGPAIFQAIIAATQDEQNDQGHDQWNSVVYGVLTSIIHHTDTENFKEIQQVILVRAEATTDAFGSSKTKFDFDCLLMSARCIGISAGVRMGTRVSDWPGLLRAMAGILNAIFNESTMVSALNAENHLWTSVASSVAIMLQYTPMDAVLPFIIGLLGCLVKDPFAGLFLTFCSYLSAADSDCFRSLVLPYFQKFIVAHWSDADNCDTLSVLLPRMITSGVLPARFGEGGFSLPQSWQDQIVSKFEHLETTPSPEQASHGQSPNIWHDRCLPKYNALLILLECTNVHPSTSGRIAEIILRKLKLALRPSSALALEEAHFLVGRGFSAYTRMSQDNGEVDTSLRPLLLAAAPRYSRLPQFLEALLAFEKNLRMSSNSQMNVLSSPSPSVASSMERMPDDLIEALVVNLSLGSHNLRLLSLQLLDLFRGTSEALALMITIEQIPLDLQSGRTASMHIRKLAILYTNETIDPLLAQAIPAFCFGMMSVKMAQVWDDAILSIKQIAESKTGEEAVAALAFEWLETPSNRWTAAKKVETPSNNGLTDFECVNLMRIDQMAETAEQEAVNAKDTMLQSFEDTQNLIEPRPPSARTQALRVLTAIPKLAEKRSCQLVPMFLSWADKDGDPSMEYENREHTHSDWTRKDQKGLLDLLSIFANPKALYRATEVYEALLRLLTNGDIDIQKSALKAIFTWKDQCVRPYEENLINLLDDSRFKDEIGVLLQGETLIQSDHRSGLMPVMLRLLYGRTISRKGAGSGKQGMEARRSTVIRNFSIEDMRDYLDIALGELKALDLDMKDAMQPSALDCEIRSVRKQVGFTHMIEDILKELGTKVAPFVKKLLNAVLYCLVFSTRRLRYETTESEEVATYASQTSMLKSVRQIALRCLILLFANVPESDWSSYVGLIVDEVVAPCLAKLPVETSQGVSGVLRLLSTWSNSHHSLLLLGSNDQIMSKVADCLVPTTSKDEVKLFVLNIIKNVVRFADRGGETVKSPSIQSQLLDPNINHILTTIGELLRSKQETSKDLLEACINTVSELAPLVSTSTQAHSLIDISVFLLDQPSRKVSPRAKSGLLQILEHFVPLYELQIDTDLRDKVYTTITALFSFFKDKASREVLSRVLLVYSQKDPIIANVAALCIELNAFVPERLEEPDYDRRLKAFNKLKVHSEPPWSPWQWTAILHNLLFYIRYDEEFSILSSNSADAICAFIDAAGKAQRGSDGPKFMTMLAKILMPAIFSGVREPSEVIRREYMKVTAHLIRTLPEWSEVCDMQSLLAGEDEVELSFFNNIITAGKGRQSNALKLLAATAEQGKLSSKNVSQLFLPLIEHFILDRDEGSDAHNLAAEASTTVSVLAGFLEWPQYRAVLRRYISYVQAKPGMQKQIIRLLGKFIDTLTLRAQENQERTIRLAQSMTKQEKLASDLTSTLLPPLVAYLHHKDDSTVSLRVSVAVIVVRLLKLLPEEQLNKRLPAVLTDVSHILRSKAPEARDMARDTLTKICVLLGPSCFGFVLKELRGALAKGYQLHVLSYTMHSILVATIPEYTPGDLDYCLTDIVAIIMDDIFGAAGQEKDAEEYISKMKEVKSSKSYDSMELITRTATLSRLTALLHPVQVLLKEKLNLRMVRKIDELLNRISSGFLRNLAAQKRGSLVFCYEVIQDFYKNDAPVESGKQDYKLRRYLIQKDANRSGDKGATTVYNYKLVRFAFDILRSLFKKYDALRTPTNVAGFIPILGDAIVQAEEEVKVAAIKLLSTVVKVPVKAVSDWKNLYHIAAVEATKGIIGSSMTTTDIAQASLKLLSVILRDRREVKVKETSMDELLLKLKDDMTEPERRHTTFNFLRAVLDSKVETAVVYDTLDYIGTVMVTNDDKDTRDLARGAYFQFLREYPQKKNRWSKQLAFIIANLKYDREGGRLSILEVVHLLLSKSSQDFVQEVSATCFVPLIFVLANDDSEKCRMAAGEVIKDIFKKADQARMKTFMTLLRSWIGQDENSAVQRLAYQTFGFYYGSQEVGVETDIDMLLGSIQDALESAYEDDSDWEVMFAALQLTAVLCKKFPKIILSSNNAALWAAIHASLSYPHAWVKVSAAKLTGIFFADIARNNIDSKLQGLPLKGSGGLSLDADDLTSLVRRTTGMFRTPNLGELLADEIVKNLLFLARCAEANDLSWKLSKTDEDLVENEDGVQPKKTALHYIFAQLSYHLRQDTAPPRAPALVPNTACLQLLNHLTNKLSATTLTSNLSIILLPLHHLTDPTIPSPYSTDPLFHTNYQNLKDSATEIMENLKRKVGTEKYTKAFMEVREGVKSRRAERSGKRKIEAITMPEKYGEGKRRKTVKQKEKRRERGVEWREIRRASQM